MTDKIVIYKSKKKAGLILLVGLLLALGGWVILRHAGQGVTGWSVIILGLLCVLFGIGSWFDRKPYIILTAAGITELTGIRQEIEWDAIRRVDEFYHRGQYFIRLLTDRTYKPTLLQPTWFHRFDRLYEREGVKAIIIRTGFLEVNSIKLSQFINRMIQADAAQRTEILHQFRLSELTHAGRKAN